MTPKRKMVVFDLDDTLYKEEDFLRSAYMEIAHSVEGDCDSEDQECQQSDPLSELFNTQFLNFQGNL